MKLLPTLAIILVLSSSLGLASGSLPHRINPTSPTVSDKILKLDVKWSCLLCSVGLDLLMQYVVVHPQPFDVFIEEHFCTLFKNELLRDTCIEFIKIYGGSIIAGLMSKLSSDEICQLVGLCDSGECRLRPKKYPYPQLSFTIEGYLKYRGMPIKQNGLKPWQWIKDLIDKVFKDHQPAFDLDSDGFSDVSWLRGSNWRGKDCNDLDGSIYPGRKINPKFNPGIDFNCNGIKGIDPQTKKPWKELLCENTNPLGVAVVGDSAGAHFAIPSAWFNVSQWASGAFDDLLTRFLNEIDLPHLSGYTGYVDSTENLSVRSVYKYLREMNLCNHRDFQNIAVNGGDSLETISNMKAFKRDPKNDHPMLVFLELIGNDVCYGPTEPADFKENILNVLDLLNSTLPKGSHVVMLGLVNGSLLYENLHDSLHPIGVTYEDFYEYITCQQSNPCVGWLTKDPVARAATTKRAFELNDQYKAIMNEGRVWANFDHVYYDFPTEDIMARAEAQGIDIRELIEPVDGFHPSQLFHAMLGDWLWETLKRDRPMWIGETNPNNQRIIQLFGNQGGH